MKILLLCLWVVGMAFGAGQEKPPKPIHERGRVQPGVEVGCLMLVTMDEKTTYNILVAKNPPKAGDQIEIWGQEYLGPTTCMQGKAVKVDKWVPIKE